MTDLNCLAAAAHWQPEASSRLSAARTQRAVLPDSQCPLKWLQSLCLLVLLFASGHVPVPLAHSVPLLTATGICPQTVEQRDQIRRKT